MRKMVGFAVIATENGGEHYIGAGFHRARPNLKEGKP